jgi:Tfp pilus assembly protein PilX
MTTRSRARIAQEGGFTLAIAMGIMMIASIVTVAAFTAARGDIKPSAANSNRKVAYAAAEAGVAWYMSKLTADPDYWQKCDTGTSGGVPDPVNQPNVSAGARKWKRVPGSPATG